MPVTIVVVVPPVVSPALRSVLRAGARRAAVDDLALDRRRRRAGRHFAAAACAPDPGDKGDSTRAGCSDADAVADLPRHPLQLVAGGGDALGLLLLLRLGANGADQHRRRAADDDDAHDHRDEQLDQGHARLAGRHPPGAGEVDASSRHDLEPARRRACGSGAPAALTALISSRWRPRSSCFSRSGELQCFQACRSSLQLNLVPTCSVGRGSGRPDCAARLRRRARR